VNQFYDEDCRFDKENALPQNNLNDDRWDVSTIHNEPKKFDPKSQNRLSLSEGISKLEHVRFDLDLLGRKNLIFMLSGELVPSLIDREDEQT